MSRPNARSRHRNRRCRKVNPMTHRITISLALLCALIGAPAFADPAKDVEATTQQWTAAFNPKSAADIVALYAKDAVFFGTTSPILRDTPALVQDYFKN